MAQSSPIPAVTNGDERVEISRRAWDVLGFSPLDRAKRLRNDRINARSPLMEGCLIECQNTAYDRNLLQIEDYLYANAPFDSGAEH